MANYTKSFNFRNGVQVDDSNFIVNPVGLVGIGTTIPEKHLDVRGDGVKAVRYDRLIPVLIEAVKELTKKVNSLENK